MKKIKAEKKALRKILSVYEMKQKIKGLTYTERAVYELLFSLCMNHTYAEISQGQIAEKLKISRKHCNQAIQKLKDIGILNVDDRIYRTCIYSIPRVVFLDTYKHMLMNFFNAVRYIPIVYTFLGALLSWSSLVTPLNITVLKRIKPVLKGRLMEQLVPQHIRNIKSIELTPHGMVKLSAFPAEAIEEVEKIMQHAKNIKDPYGWFFRMCRNFCLREGFEPDWTYVDFLKKKLQIDENSPRTVTDYIYRDRYLKQHHPELAHNEKQVPSYAKKVSAATKPVEAPKPKPTPRDVLESRKRVKEFAALTPLEKKEKKEFEDFIANRALRMIPEDEIHAGDHKIQTFSTIDDELKKPLLCARHFCFASPYELLPIEKPSPSVPVEEVCKKIYSYEELCAMADSGMKSIGSVIEGIPAFSMIKENASSLEERKREDLKRE